MAHLGSGRSRGARQLHHLYGLDGGLSVTSSSSLERLLGPALGGHDGREAVQNPGFKGLLKLRCLHEFWLMESWSLQVVLNCMVFARNLAKCGKKRQIWKASGLE